MNQSLLIKTNNANNNNNKKENDMLIMLSTTFLGLKPEKKMLCVLQSKYIIEVNPYNIMSHKMILQPKIPSHMYMKNDKYIRYKSGGQIMLNTKTNEK